MTLETDKESISDLFVSSFEVFSYESSREVKREREKKRKSSKKSIFSIKCWKGDELPDNSTL